MVEISLTHKDMSSWLERDRLGKEPFSIGLFGKELGWVKFFTW